MTYNISIPLMAIHFPYNIVFLHAEAIICWKLVSTQRGKCDNKIRTLYFHSIILNLCDEQSWNDTHYAIRIYSAHASGDLSASAKRSGKQHPLTQHYRAILGEQNKAAAAARVHAAERRIYCAISLSGEMKHSAVPGTHICKFRSLNVRVQWQSDVI